MPTNAPPGQIILLAEDDVLVRNFVRSFLQRKGYEVLAAANGKEALELAQTHSGSIDLFLADVQMPFTDGVSAYRQINSQRPETKVLFMSGGTVEDELPEPWPFLSKPFDINGLLHLVEHILAERAVA